MHGVRQGKAPVPHDCTAGHARVMITGRKVPDVIPPPRCAAVPAPRRPHMHDAAALSGPHRHAACGVCLPTQRSFRPPHTEAPARGRPNPGQAISPQGCHVIATAKQYEPGGMRLPPGCATPHRTRSRSSGTPGRAMPATGGPRGGLSCTAGRGVRNGKGMGGIGATFTCMTAPGDHGPYGMPRDAFWRA